MFWTRVDNRLVHGQVIETWLPFTNAKSLVVANDELAENVLQQEIMSLAIPHNVTPHFVHVEDLFAFFRENKMNTGQSDVLVLFATCQDAQRSFESGFSFPMLNIANLHYGPGKKQLCAHVSVSTEDETCLQFFSGHGVEIDFRCIPTEQVQVKQLW